MVDLKRYLSLKYMLSLVSFGLIFCNITDGFAAPPKDAMSLQDELKPNELTLSALTRCARENNPALEIALAQLESAKSKLTLAGAVDYRALVLTA